MDALRRQRIAQGRGDLGDVAFAAGALVVEQARDAAVGVRFEMTERQVLQLPLQLPDAQAIGQRRVDVAGQLRQCDALVFRQLRGRAQLGQLPRSEEHTSELQSLMPISYAVFCLKKK